MPVCSVCDTPLPQDSRFCPSCGTPVPGPGGTTAVPDPAREQLERLRRVLNGRFEVLQELGRGGMASVYLARQISLDRELAIKVLNPALNQDADLVQRFLREARTQGRLEHPGIIPVYEVYQEAGFSFYTMPRIQGPSLRLFLKENPKPPIDTMRRLMHEAADALGYAHRQGLIHRDVKPENMLLDAQRHRMILTDFGIAKTLSSVTMLTLTGEQLGTPRYMAPDQGDTKRPLDGRSDQYSLGLVAYEMLAGRMAFQADNLAELMYKHRYEEAEPLATLRPDAPPGLVAAVMRAISKNRDERFPTMEEFGAALMIDEAPAPVSSRPTFSEEMRPLTPEVEPPAAAVPAFPPPAPAAPAPAPAASLMSATSPPTPMSSGGVWRHDPVKGWTLEPALAEPFPVIPPAPAEGKKKRKKGAEGRGQGVPPLVGSRGRRRSLWKWIGLGVGVVVLINALGGRKPKRVRVGGVTVAQQEAAEQDAARDAEPDGTPPTPPAPIPAVAEAPAPPPGLSPEEWQKAVQSFAVVQGDIESAFGGTVPPEVANLVGLRARAESLAAGGNLRDGIKLMVDATGDLRRLSRRAAQEKVALGIAEGAAARARSAAVVAGADRTRDGEFSAADELRDAAIEERDAGRLDAAEQKFRAAAKAYAALARPVAGAPAAQPAPTMDAQPIVPTPETTDPTAQINEQLDRFATLFATEDVAGIQAGFPRLELRRGDVALFQAIFDRADDLSVARRQTRIVGGAGARTADVDYELSFVQSRTHDAGRQMMKVRARFVPDGQGAWQLVSLVRR